MAKQESTCNHKEIYLNSRELQVIHDNNKVNENKDVLLHKKKHRCQNILIEIIKLYKLLRDEILTNNNNMKLLAHMQWALTKCIYMKL